MTIPMVADTATNYGNRPGEGPLRPGGVSLPGTPSTDENLPSTLSACAKRQQPALTLVRDLFAGAEKVRERGTVYLPQAPGEDPQNYTVRLKRSVFLEAFGNTVDGLTGFVFRRDPILGPDVPAPIVEHAENIDMAGTHLTVFAREQLQDALTAGHGAILVDYPDTGGAQLSLGDEAKYRPYWVPIKKDNIVSWRTEVIDGQTVLTQVVLRECTCVAKGAFGEQEQTLYRVLYRLPATDTGAAVVGWQLLEVTEQKAVIVHGGGLYPTQDEIPLAEIITSGRKSMFESRPPLLGLAYLAVAYYQQWSDTATSIHKTCVPIFVTIGLDVGDEAEPLVLGPNATVDLPVGGDAKYVSHDGQAIGECRAALADIKADMATLGLAQLSPDKRAAETATAKRIDKSASDSALAVTARGLQDGLERALGFHAKYLKLPSGGSITVNRDFENLSLTAQEITALSGLVAKGQLTLETMWDMLIEGNTLPETFDKDDEKARLDAEAEIERQRAVDALAEQARFTPTPTANAIPLGSA